MKLYNQVKRDQWREDEYCMPVIARYGTGGNNSPIVLVYDARGNVGGSAAPTITGDHQNRITDYTAIVVTKKLNY